MSVAAAMPTSSDAFVILPGIMGSKLIDTATGKTLWGFSPRVYVDAWLTGHSLEELAVSDDERAGKTGRVKASSLLTLPAYAPGFLGLDKYTKHVDATRRRLAKHPDAVLEFPYDWRLSVEHNAKLLADVAADHLKAWQSHPQGDPQAKLILLAHSMGGLVARYFTNVLGGDAIVRTTITMGTPYFGSIIPPHMMSTGRGAPLPMPHKRMKKLVRQMPGMHDLLPFFPAVRLGDRAERISPDLIQSLGGDAELARESIARHERIVGGDGGATRLLVGVNQPTAQSFAVDDHGRAVPAEESFDERTGAWSDRMGDGTVPRVSAGLLGLPAGTLLEVHSSLPMTDEANEAIRDIVLNQVPGAALDAGAGFGVAVPDVVPVTEPVVIRIVSEWLEAANVVVIDQESGQQVAAVGTSRAGDDLISRFTVPRPGLYRVQVKAGAKTVNQTVMVTPPAELVADDT